MGSIISMMEHELENKQNKPRRSLPFWTLLAGYVFLTAAGAARMIESISNWYWLNFAGVRPGPGYLVITGGLWAAAGLLALIWLWFHLPGYRLVGIGAALFMAITYWLDRLLVRNPENQMQNTGFVLFLSLLLLLFVTAVLRPWTSFRSPKG